jgi:hypothetical protein
VNHHSQNDDPREVLAEAIVFAHEPEAPTPSAASGVSNAERRALERTAALASAACALQEPLPLRLQQSLAAAGLAFCAERAQQAKQPTLSPTHGSGFVTSLSRRPWRTWLGGASIGAAAAAAALWVAFVQPKHRECEHWQQSQQATAAELASSSKELAARTQQLATQAELLATRDRQLAERAAELAALQPSEAELRARRAAVLANDHQAFHREWKPGPSARDSHFSGDVVWSHERQDGWLSFRGLPKLDPDHAYQLWIVDQRRDGPPVDGGLFTIQNPEAETLVPIHAHLRVEHPVAFVITIEPKNGVVVSKQEQVVAIAGS